MGPCKAVLRLRPLETRPDGTPPAACGIGDAEARLASSPSPEPAINSTSTASP